MGKKIEKRHYINSGYIRYLVYLHGGNYKKITNEQKVQRDEKRKGMSQEEAEEEARVFCNLNSERLSACCEDMGYDGTGKEGLDEEGRENGIHLPVEAERFVNSLCEYFNVEKQEICFDRAEVPQWNNEAALCSWWQKKRGELREKRNRRIREAEHMEMILIEAVKLCDLGRLRRIWISLEDFLRPHTRRFWMEMEGELSRLNLYLGVPAVIALFPFEEDRMPDPGKRKKTGFQKNEPLDKKTLYALAKRQRVSGQQGLAEKLFVRRQKLSELVKEGWKDTPGNIETATWLEWILHAGWEELRGGDCQSEAGNAGKDQNFWETAEEQLGQAVRSVKLEEWERDHDAWRLMMKHILRLCLCCQEEEVNRQLLDELERRVKECVEIDGRNAGGGQETQTMGNFMQCIRELKQEDQSTADLYCLLLQKSVEADGFYGRKYLEEEEKRVQIFCQEEACTQEEQKLIWQYVREKQSPKPLQDEKRNRFRDLFHDAWISSVRENIVSNPWYLDLKLRIRLLRKGDDVVDNKITGFLRLPEELERIYEIGDMEVQLELPKEGEEMASDWIGQNWDKIQAVLEDSLELEGWEAELLDEWIQWVWYDYVWLDMEDYEIFDYGNAMIDQQLPDEVYGSRYDRLVAFGRSLLKDRPDMAEHDEACYEYAIFTIKNGMRSREKQ